MKLIQKIKKKIYEKKIHKIFEEVVDLLIDEIMQPDMEEIIKECPFCQCNLHYIKNHVDYLIDIGIMTSYQEAINNRTNEIIKTFDDYSEK